MTPQQRAALEEVVGRPLTEAEVTALDPAVAQRNDVFIAEYLSQGRRRPDPVTKYMSPGISERFPALIDPVLGALPGPMAAELVLQKLETFSQTQAVSEVAVQRLLAAQVKRQMQHLNNTGLALGSSAFTPMFEILVAQGVLRQPEVDALRSVGTVPDPLGLSAVSRALNEAEGRMTL